MTSRLFSSILPPPARQKENNARLLRYRFEQRCSSSALWSRYICTHDLFPPTNRRKTLAQYFPHPAYCSTIQRIDETCRDRASEMIDKRRTIYEQAERKQRPLFKTYAMSEWRTLCHIVRSIIDNASSSLLVDS